MGVGASDRGELGRCDSKLLRGYARVQPCHGHGGQRWATRLLHGRPGRSSNHVHASARDTAVPSGKQPVEIYLEVEDVDALHNRLKKNGVGISDPLTLQWWGDRTFKVLDPNGYEIWFYTTSPSRSRLKGQSSSERVISASSLFRWRTSWQISTWPWPQAKTRLNR